MAVKRKTTKRVASKSKAKTARKTVAKKAAVKKTTSTVKTAPKAAAKTSKKAMQFNADVMRNALSSGATEAQKMQKEAIAMSREGAQHFAKTADAATRSLNEAVSIGKDHMDACVECGSIAVDVSKNLGNEMASLANDAFTKNVEMSKQLFACRTLNDMFELQSKMLQHNMENLFANSVKMSEMVFKGASDVSEPLNEKVQESAEKMRKVMAA